MNEMRITLANGVEIRFVEGTMTRVDGGEFTEEDIRLLSEEYVRQNYGE